MPELIRTDDGSPSLYVAALDEHYHSTRGAIQESWHVYIQAGLVAALHTSRPVLRLLEVGFGTGLNALLTWEYLKLHAPEQALTYDTVEKFPLTNELVMAYTAALPNPVTERLVDFHALHDAPWESHISLSPTFKLRKLQADFETLLLEGSCYDIIYYDAFAPRKQPELWTDRLLAHVASLLAPGGVIVTYCATGALKRAWRAAGLQLESLPGAPGKREMVRAKRPEIPKTA